MDEAVPLRFLVFGKLQRDYILPQAGQPILDIPGGNALHAAAGLAVWESGIGLVSRVGSDYPQDWFARFVKAGVSQRGIRRLADPLDMRFFSSISPAGDCLQDNPVGAFAQAGYPFPKDLLSYHPVTNELDSRTKFNPSSIRSSDVPTEFLDASAAHLCPVDYVTHSMLPSFLREGHITTITVDPSPGYMNPIFWDDVRSLLPGVTAFLPSEESLYNLFQGRSVDVWEMAESLTSSGCEMIVIKRGISSQLLYDATTRKRWIIPAYPGKISNPLAYADAFCGGFLAGWRRTYDPLQAVMHGNISAALVTESFDAFYAYGCMPGLADARLGYLKNLVQPI